MREVKLRRKKGQKLGFSIRGGKEYGIGVFVSDVETGSQAEAQGLKLGDEILRINGFPLDQSVHDEVKQLCRDANIVLTVRGAGMIPVQDHHGDPIKWKPTGKENTVIKKTSISDSIEMKLFIDLTDHKELGCTILKGPPEHPGIFVQSVKLNSVAYEIGIQAGDQIVEVNQFQFNQVEFQTAVNHLKASKQLELVIRKGAGREFIPAESSGYNSSNSSVNEDTEEQKTLHKLQMPSTLPTSDAKKENIQKENGTVRDIDTKEHNRRHSSCSSKGDRDSLLEDRFEEEWVVEEIRKAAEDEMNKDAEETESPDVGKSKRPQYRDQQVQTDLSPMSDNESPEKARSRSGQIWQRTVIAEVHNNPLPSPPPLPPAEPTSPAPINNRRSSPPPNNNFNHANRNSKTIPLKMAEDMQKRMQHDQLIEEFKQVQRAMRNVQNGHIEEERVQVDEYPKSPFSKKSESVPKIPKPVYSDQSDMADGIARRQSPVTKIPVNQNSRHTIGDFSQVKLFGKELRPTKWENGVGHQPKPSSDNNSNGDSKPTYYYSSTEEHLKQKTTTTTTTRRGPLVTIGTYGESRPRPGPNRFSFLNGSTTNGTDAKPSTYQHQQSTINDKNYNTSYTTVIQNGPTKSTAVIETSSNVGKSVNGSKQSPDIVRNKVTIKVPAANGIKSAKKDTEIKPKQKAFTPKHLTFEDVPIIIEDMPIQPIEVKDFNPHKLFTEAQIAGREIRMYSLPRANPLDIQIEGGLGTPLNGRVIVSRVVEGGEIYKHRVITKGDQLMWVYGHSFLDITLSQAQGILRSAAKEKKEPLKIIVAKAHPGLYDEM